MRSHYLGRRDILRYAGACAALLIEHALAGARPSPTPSSAPAIIYSQPPSPGGGLLLSSWWDPDGSDYDQYVWDNFTLQADHTLSELRWRGGYDPAKFGSGGPALDFTIAVYPSIAAGTQPDVVHPPLVRYQAGGKAGETPAGTFGGAAMYDYHFALPAPFSAAAGVTYWLQIEATQHGIPDWCVALGGGGDGAHFRRVAGQGDVVYQAAPGDAALALVGSPAGKRRTYLPLVRS